MMSDLAKKHYARYLENISLAEEIEKHLPARRAWSCVARFYAALHLMNAFLIDKAISISIPNRPSTRSAGAR